MSRRSKILFVVGCGVAGLLAWHFFSGANESEVRLTFSEVASNRVSVTLSNCSTNAVEFFFVTREFYPEFDAEASRDPGKLAGHSTTTTQFIINSTNQWQFVTYYGFTLPQPYGSGAPYFTFTLRNRLVMFALNHGWDRLSEWLSPGHPGKRVSGPIMQGTKPREPGAK